MKGKLFHRGIKRLFNVVLALVIVISVVSTMNLDAKAETLPTITVPAEFNGWYAGVYANYDFYASLGPAIDGYYAGDGLGAAVWSDGDATTLMGNIGWNDAAGGTYFGQISNNVFQTPSDGNFWAYFLCESNSMTAGSKWAILVKEVTRDQDATYTTGDIYLSGIFGQEGVHIDVTSGSTPTPTPSSDSKPSESTEAAKPAEPAKSEIEEREAIEEGMSVEPVTVDMTQFSKADSAVVPGTTYNLSNFMTTKGIVKGINAAVAASNKSGSKTVTIYSGNPLCFNETIIKAIQNGKKDVVYYFTYNGHLYSVTVPASVDASKVLEKAGVAGPLYVGKQLGTTRLIK